MTPTRRDFIRHSALAGGALVSGALTPGLARPLSATPATLGAPARHAPRRIRLLILGGTGFIGPHQVRYAVERGHEVTIFNRGRSEPEMFADAFRGVENLIGDRNGDLEALGGRTWDVVIDNARSNPRWVTLTAELLRDSVGLYQFISSRSAYRDTSRVPMTSDHPTVTWESAGVSRDTPPNRLPYGLAKAESEREVRRVYGDRGVIIRPGLIIGPGDETDRFTYWPVRIHRGGEVLAPGDPSDPVQIIDVRDLTEWQIHLAENRTAGVYTAVGPATPRPIAELLYGIRAVTTAETTFTWVPADFLARHDVRPYREMPVWQPPVPGREGFARFDLSREVAAGLTFRPLAVTTRDTLDWYFARPPERQAELRAGISAEREREVLAAWHHVPRSPGHTNGETIDP